MFEVKRIFCQTNNDTQLPEWFFQAREGVIGPYESREVAEKVLQGFIAHCQARGSDGGRSGRQEVGLALEPMEPFQIAWQFDPVKRKKGIDSIN